MDMCEEMAGKYLKDRRSPNDYLTTTEDLAWTSSICQNTLFFRVAVLLLKMRAYSVSSQKKKQSVW